MCSGPVTIALRASTQVAASPWLGLRAFANANRLAPLYANPDWRRQLKATAIWEIETGRKLTLDAVQQDGVLWRAFGAGFVEHYLQVKRHEVQRHESAPDKDAWQRREYFSRF